MTQSEKSAIYKKSKKAQLTLTEYILKSSLQSEIKVVDLQPLLVELKRIGNNLNQIAQKAHVLNVVDVQRYDKAVRHFEQTVRVITEAVVLPDKAE